MSIRIGIIGAGAIGRSHAKAAAATGVTLACIADVNAQAAQTFAAECNVPASTGDPQTLLNAPDIDAVIVAVPNKFHKPLAIAALEAGKDVLLEKPMGLNVAECQAINDAAAKTDRLLQIGLVHRYSAVAQTAGAFIERGRVGQIYHAKASFYRRRGIPGLGGWFTTKALAGGGPLIDIGVHAIDLALLLMGHPQPTRVSGRVYANFGSRMKDYCHESMWAGPPRLDGTFDVEDSAHALVHFDNGSTLEINTTWAGNTPDQGLPSGITLLGDRGGLNFALGGNRVELITEQDGHNVDVIPKLRPTNVFEAQMRSFAQAVQTREPQGADGQAGQAVQSIIDAIYLSSEQGREVELRTTPLHRVQAVDPVTEPGAASQNV